MKTLHIIGVPEHFNYAFRLLEKEQPLQSEGVEISWREESRGSGQMIQELNQGNADFAILLTESFLKEAESNSDLKMIGFHVESPLIWGIHVSPDHYLNQAADIREPHFLVSRMGSGSQLMAKVLVNSLQNPNLDSPVFDVIGNLDGAIQAMENGNKGMFLWEKYTTSPTVKSGKMKRIGELPSPWPCFVMVVNGRAFETFGENLITVRNWIYEKNKRLKGDPNLPNQLADAYHLNLEEVKAWLSQTRWAEKPEINLGELEKTIDQVYRLGIIQKKLDPSSFLVKVGLDLL